MQLANDFQQTVIILTSSSPDNLSLDRESFSFVHNLSPSNTPHITLASFIAEITSSSSSYSSPFLLVFKCPPSPSALYTVSSAFDADRDPDTSYLPRSAAGSVRPLATYFSQTVPSSPNAYIPFSTLSTPCYLAPFSSNADP